MTSLTDLCAKAHEYFTTFDEDNFIYANGYRNSKLIIKTLFECIDRFGLDLRDHQLLGYDHTGSYNSVDKNFLFGSFVNPEFTEEDIVFLVWHEFGHCVDHKMNKLLLKFQRNRWIVTFKTDLDNYYERRAEDAAFLPIEYYCRLPEEASANAFAVLHCGLKDAPENHVPHWEAGKEKLTKDQNLAICAV